MPTKGSGHGLKGTPEYSTWVNMRQRCNNPQGHDVRYYKNITICPEWDDPICFALDMGKRPSKNHQIDRIDNTQGYSKENCKWVEKKQQMRNTRIAKIWYVYGVRYESLSEAANVFKTSPGRIKGWCDGRSDGGYVYPPKLNCWSEKRYES